jgi:hypothetical protein
MEGHWDAIGGPLGKRRKKWQRKQEREVLKGD